MRAFFVYTTLKGGEGMKKLIVLESLVAASIIATTPVFAQTPTGSVTQIQSFIQSVIQVLKDNFWRL